MKIVVTRGITLYKIEGGRVRMAPVPPGTYELEVIGNPEYPGAGPWYQLKGTTFGAGTTWIEEMGNDPGKTGVTFVGVGENAPSPQQPQKKRKWF